MLGSIVSRLAAPTWCGGGEMAKTFFWPASVFFFFCLKHMENWKSQNHIWGRSTDRQTQSHISASLRCRGATNRNITEFFASCGISMHFSQFDPVRIKLEYSDLRMLIFSIWYWSLQNSELQSFIWQVLGIWTAFSGWQRPQIEVELTDLNHQPLTVLCWSFPPPGSHCDLYIYLE